MLRFLHILLFTLIISSVSAQHPTTQKPFVKDRMQKAITTYQAMLEANNWNTLPEGIYLRPGDKGKYIAALQENLILTGDLPIDSAKEPALYTQALKTAVLKFQSRHGLIADGVAGPNTIATLNVPLSERVKQLQINLSKWDSSFFSVQQPYIVINLPDYTLQVVDNDKTTMHMRVIIGELDLKTYPIISELNMVVLYPYWYIPKSIAVKEIVPILRRNPGYLAKKGMKLEVKNAKGWVRVNPWRVNWSSINAANYPYRLVQLSGRQNELGQVKFLYPNKTPQYLHDTPRKELFNYPNRTFSHGCIRLEKPIELADFILERGSGYSQEKVASLWESSPPNKYLRVKKPLPLHIVYLTAWVDELSQIQFREDMYGFHQVSQIIVK